MSPTQESPARPSSFSNTPDDELALASVNALYNQIQEEITSAQHEARTTSAAYEAEQWAPLQEELNRQRQQLHNRAIQMEIGRMQVYSQYRDAARAARMAARPTPAIPATTPAPPPTPTWSSVELSSSRFRVANTGVMTEIESDVQREIVAEIDPSVEFAMGTYEMRAQLNSFIQMLRRLERYYCLDPADAWPRIQSYMQQVQAMGPDPLEIERLAEEQRRYDLRSVGFELRGPGARAQARQANRAVVNHAEEMPAEFQRQRELVQEEFRVLLRQRPVPDFEFDGDGDIDEDEGGGVEQSDLPDLVSDHGSLSSDGLDSELESPRTATIRAQFPLRVAPTPPPQGATVDREMSDSVSDDIDDDDESVYGDEEARLVAYSTGTNSITDRARAREQWLQGHNTMPIRPQPQMSAAPAASRRRGLPQSEQLLRIRAGIARIRERLVPLERQLQQLEERRRQAPPQLHIPPSHAPSRRPLHRRNFPASSRALQLHPSNLQARGILMPQLDPPEVDERGFTVLRTREQIRVSNLSVRWRLWWREREFRGFLRRGAGRVGVRW